MSGYELSPRDKPCPSCGAVLALDALLCTRCGHDLRSGRRHALAALDSAADAKRKPAKAAFPCGGCGYDLGGLPPGSACPECGRSAEARAKGGPAKTRNGVSVAAQTQEDRREAEIVSYWRTTWLVAGIGLVVGAALSVGIGAAAGHHATGDADGAVAGALGGVLRVVMCEVAVFAGYFGICLLWLGFEEDVRGLILRLIGIAAVWAGLLALVTLLPFGGFGGLIVNAVVSVLALAIPLHVLSGRDLDDSFWIGGACWAAWFISHIVIGLIAANLL